MRGACCLDESNIPCWRQVCRRCGKNNKNIIILTDCLDGVAAAGNDCECRHLLGVQPDFKMVLRLAGILVMHALGRSGVACLNSGGDHVIQRLSTLAFVLFLFIQLRSVPFSGTELAPYRDPVQN